MYQLITILKTDKMTTGSKTLKIDSKSIVDSIIMEKCNAKEMSHHVVISDMTNWIIDEFDSHGGKDHVVKQLRKKWYEVCLRREADHYASIQGSVLHFPIIWLRSVK